jgi:hypothetical protein
MKSGDRLAFAAGFSLMNQQQQPKKNTDIHMGGEELEHRAISFFEVLVLVLLLPRCQACVLEAFAVFYCTCVSID